MLAGAALGAGLFAVLSAWHLVASRRPNSISAAQEPEVLVLAIMLAAVIGAVAGLVFGTLVGAVAAVGHHRGGRTIAVRLCAAAVAAIGGASPLVLVYGVRSDPADVAALVGLSLAVAVVAAAIAWSLTPWLTRPAPGRHVAGSGG